MIPFFIFTTAYRGALVSILTVELPGSPMDTMKELARNNITGTNEYGQMKPPFESKMSIIQAGLVLCKSPAMPMLTCISIPCARAFK